MVVGLFVSGIWGSILLYADKIFFAFYFVSICYLFVFAIASVIKRNKRYAPARKEYRYVLLIFARDKYAEVSESVQSFFAVDYPRDKYDVVVISHKGHDSQVSALVARGARVIECSEDISSKPMGIKYAMSILDENSYDVAIVMDPGSIVDVDFLSAINNAYYCGGSAIQTHIMTRNFETDTALFAAVSEEINNSIFRRGHVNFGFSSALIGSGMAFKFDWLKVNIANAKNIDLEKQLESMLLEQFIFIDYLGDVNVYGEKAVRAGDLYEQRSSWLATRWRTILSMVRKLPVALAKGNYDYCDKMIQWLMPSRMILLGSLIPIIGFLLIVEWVMAIKWIALFLMIVVAFSIALPDYLIDARFVKAVRGAPIILFLTVFNAFKRKLSSHNK